MGILGPISGFLWYLLTQSLVRTPLAAHFVTYVHVQAALGLMQLVLHPICGASPSGACGSSGPSSGHARWESSVRSLNNLATHSV